MLTTARLRRGVIAAATLTLSFGATTATAAAPPEPTPVATALTSSTRVHVGRVRATRRRPRRQRRHVAADRGNADERDHRAMDRRVDRRAVASIDEAGCPAAIVTELPSTLNPTGEVLGPEDVAYLDGELYISVDGGGPGHGNPDNPSGIYRVADDGSPELVADLSAWVRENPVAAIPATPILTRPVTRWSSSRRRARCGSTTRTAGRSSAWRPTARSPSVVDLSDPHIVPTRLALDPAGGVFVGTLTTVPFPDGAAQVMHVGTDGTVEVVWTGLTTVVDVAVGADGTLYALELSTGNLPEPPFLTRQRSDRAPNRTGHRRARARRTDAPDRHGDRTGRIVLRVRAGNRSQRRQRQHHQPRRRPTPEGTAPAASEPMATDPAASGSGAECAPIEETTGTMPAPPGRPPAPRRRGAGVSACLRAASAPAPAAAPRQQPQRWRSQTSPSAPPSSPWPPERP